MILFFAGPAGLAGRARSSRGRRDQGGRGSQGGVSDENIPHEAEARRQHQRTYSGSFEKETEKKMSAKGVAEALVAVAKNRPLLAIGVTNGVTALVAFYIHVGGFRGIKKGAYALIFKAVVGSARLVAGDTVAAEEAKVAESIRSGVVGKIHGERYRELPKVSNPSSRTGHSEAQAQFVAGFIVCLSDKSAREFVHARLMTASTSLAGWYGYKGGGCTHE